MSNLGWYQKIVEMAKKVGGPRNLLGLTLLLGAGIAIVFDEGGRAVVKELRDKKRNQYDREKIYTVNHSDTDKAGLTLNAGDVFRVIESDDDAILIEIKGNDNNPFFVSAIWLEHISDFRKL